jgi:hypothetical protein
MAGLFPAPVLESLRASPDRPALEVEERMAVEELLAERGAEVDHVTVFRWVQRITPLLADAARFSRHSPGDRWFIDETYVKVNGRVAVRVPSGRPRPCRSRRVRGANCSRPRSHRA